MTKTEELLKVLDLPKGEQQIWWENQTGLGSIIECSIPKAAFRLRDEVINNDLKNETDNWCESSYEVFLYVIGEENERDEPGLDTWFTMYSKPIHWIIAVLIAKQKEKP